MASRRTIHVPAQGYACEFAGVDPTTLAPDDEKDRRAHVAMVAHVIGRATDADVAFLEEDVDDWRRLLVGHKTKIMALLTKMTGELDCAQRDYFASGPRGKSGWLNYLSQWRTHRSMVIGHLAAVDRALAHVNQIRMEDRNDAFGVLQRRIEELSQQVEALTERVLRLEHEQ